jgi:tetratricopeptide (TPR) repeat protein
VECHDYTNGLDTANEILAIAPTNEVGLVLKAGVYIHLQDYRQAVPLLTQVLELSPTNHLVRLNRGTAYVNLGQWEAAGRDFTTIIQNVPNAFPAYFEMAKLADHQNNLALAMTNYELFLKYAPTNMAEIPMVQARVKELKLAAP